jgi:TolB-like protein
LNPYPIDTLDLGDPLSPDQWRPMVAVLPFLHAGHASLRLVGQDIADALREALESDPALQAILISSDFLAKAPAQSVDVVCRELRIGHVISGKCHGNPSHPSLYIEVADTVGWNVEWARFHRDGALNFLVPDSREMAELVAALRHELVTRPRR